MVKMSADSFADLVKRREELRFVGLARDAKWDEFKEKLEKKPELLLSFDGMNRSAAYWAVFHCNLEILELMLEAINKITNRHEHNIAIAYVFENPDLKRVKPSSIPYRNGQWSGDSEKLRRFYEKVTASTRI